MATTHNATAEELKRDIEAQAPPAQKEEPPKGKLSFLDSYLSLWIIIACGAGLALGQSEAVLKALRATSIGTTNILVAIGLVLMIYPPLAKVRWGKMGEVLKDHRLLVLATMLNWVLGPLLMFVLSLAFFHDSSPGFMAGLSLVGCARCIAMVLVWNELAGGDNEYCAAIVALNALLTIVLYPPFSFFYLLTLPKAIFGGGALVDVTVSQIAVSVGIYLGVPLAAAVLTWAAFTQTKGTEWYTSKVTPVLGRLTLPALLFTVVVLFTAQSRSMVHKAADVAYTALPLLIYFFVMFVLSFRLAQLCGATYAQTVTLAFTAASNNFELALAVAVGSFGLQSDQSLVSVVGALCEIPTMLALVRIALYFRTHLTFKEDKGANLERAAEAEMIKQ